MGSQIRLYLECTDTQEQRLQMVYQCLPQWYQVESLSIEREIVSRDPSRRFLLVLLNILDYSLFAYNLLFDELVSNRTISRKEFACTSIPSIDRPHTEVTCDYLLNYFRPWKGPLDYERFLADKIRVLQQLSARLYSVDLDQQRFLELQERLVKQFPGTHIDLAFEQEDILSPDHKHRVSIMVLTFPIAGPAPHDTPLHACLNALQREQKIVYWEPICPLMETKRHSEQTAQWLMIPVKKRPCQPYSRALIPNAPPSRMKSD